jgi:hypothetical protein
MTLSTPKELSVGPTPRMRTVLPADPLMTKSGMRISLPVPTVARVEEASEIGDAVDRNQSPDNIIGLQNPGEPTSSEWVLDCCYLPMEADWRTDFGVVGSTMEAPTLFLDRRRRMRQFHRFPWAPIV